MTKPAESIQLLGPENWFEAWWVQRTERVAPQLARDSANEPALAALSLNEIGFVEGILSRLWTAEHDEWTCAEGVFLVALRDLHFERGLRLRESGGDVNEGQTALTLPGLDRIADRVAWLADELWRLEDHQSYRTWLQRVVAEPGFAVVATRDVHWRRIAVAAARLTPSPEVYDVMRSIYRDASTHDDLVRADRERFDSDVQFRDAVLEMGLHTPVRRDRVYTAPRRDAPAEATTPRVTVLIPSFKHEAFIEGAVRSALEQTIDDSAVLVVDDQSPDATFEIAQGIEDPRLTVRRNASNVGLGTSIHDALAEIDTPYVALLNSDDLFHPERLERCLEVLDSDAEAALVATGLDFVDGRGHRLTADTSCVVDVGRNVHGWLKWYEQVARELGTHDHWTAPGLLLRHNHLATSSNVVVRTDYLRAQIAEVKPLKYCIDWLLFLFAAADGVLRYVPDPLLAYRFHDSNTVWFEGGGRSDYILEVNHVLDRALRRITARRLESDGPDAAKRELATLLQEDVLRHGESSGVAGLFADILGGSAPLTGADGDEVDRLVRELMRRKAMADVAGRIDLPPDRLIELSRGAARHRVDNCVVAGALHRAEAQGKRLRRQEEELDDRGRQLREARVRLDDLGAQRDRLTAERNELAAKRDRLASERDALIGKRDQLIGERDALIGTRDALIGARNALIGERDRLASERDTLIGKRDALIGERDAVIGERDHLIGERELLRADVRGLQDEREEQRHRAEQAEQRSRELATEVGTLWARVGRLEDAIAVSEKLLEVETARARALRTAPEWRAGHLLLRRLRLLPIWKTLTRACTLASVRVRRLMGRPKGRCAVVAWEGAFPAVETRHLVPEIRCLLEASIDLRVICMEAGDDSLLATHERRLLTARRVLPSDASLSAGDRRYFEKRGAPIVNDLIALYRAEPHVLARLFTFARSCHSLGAGYLHGLGLGESAALTHGGARLLGLPFGLSVAGPDLAILRHHTARATTILKAAAIVVADTARTAQALREASGEALPALSVKAPAAYWEAPRDEIPRDEITANGCLRATAAPAGPIWELMPIADAVARAAAAGTTLQVDSLGAVRSDGSLDALRSRIDARGVGDHFSFHPDAPGQLEECLARASVLVATGGASDGRHAAIPIAALAAMAAALPVIATRGGALDGLVSDSENGLLVPAGDVDALARALQTLAADGELRLRLGRRARQDFLRDHAPAVSAARLRDTIRALLEK